MGISNVTYFLNSSCINNDSHPRTDKASSAILNGKDYTVRQQNDHLSVKAFCDNNKLNLSALFTGFVHWLKATVSSFTKQISYDEADSIAKKLMEECPNVGDALVLNFNDGSHAAVLVKTQAGYAYLSHDRKPDTKKYVEAGELSPCSDALKAFGIETSVAQAQLKDNVMNYKDNRILEHSVKMSGMNTGKMIRIFNDSRQHQKFSVFSNNCSHMATRVIKAGVKAKLNDNSDISDISDNNELAQLGSLTVRSHMSFPQHTMALAKKIKKDQPLRMSSENKPTSHSKDSTSWDVNAGSPEQSTRTHGGLRNYYRRRIPTR